MTEDAALSADERVELERLRAEVADLRSQVSTAPTSRAGRHPTLGPAAAAVALSGRDLAHCDRLHTGAASVVAVWAKNQVTNTDRYVATVAPLADDPAIQNAVADRVTAEIFSYLDVVGITNQAVDALAERGLPAARRQLHALSEPLSSGVQGFVRTEVGKVVASGAFADAW